MPHADLLVRVPPILGFLVCITIVADLADGLGVFQVVAQAASRLARGSVIGLWLLVVLVGVISTAVLSLDTTAVLLTPVVLALAVRLGLDTRLFAFTAVWLANTASLFLPVSNLTNLLALHQLQRLGTASDARGFAAQLWPAALASVLVTALGLMVIFRRSLRGRYVARERPQIPHRRLLMLAMVVCGAVGPLLLLGLNVFWVAAGAALVLVIGCLLGARSLLTWRLLPWQLVLGVTVLFVLVQIAHDHGLAALLAVVAGHGDGLLALLRLTGLAALGANLIDNLPTYLALEPVAGTPVRLAAQLIGVNAGPLVTPWASLATLLWASRCRAAGVSVNWLRFAGLGGALVLPLLAGAVVALWLSR